MPVKLNNVVPWGRSFDEYRRIFSLTDDDLNRKILDVAAGPSSFNATMHARGKNVISIDPIYEFNANQIRSRVQEVRDDMIQQVREQRGQFVWSYIQSPEHLGEIRIAAMEAFLADFESGKDRRYLTRTLPSLDFADARFDLALCSHFLFLYSDHFDVEFHLRSTEEMLRVSREVRIYPVTDLSGRLSPHLQTIQSKFKTELVEVDYEFLRGAKQMLVVQNPPSRI
jgi:hypothetical protein